ncbi:MAG: M23 family metallopeptidase [Bdellovibrionota bacterium]
MIFRFTKLALLGVFATSVGTSLAHALVADSGFERMTAEYAGISQSLQPSAESVPSEPTDELEYKVKFQPSTLRKVIFRDQMGNELGRMRDTDTLEIPIDANTIDRSRTVEGISIRTLLENLPRVTTSAGTTLPLQISVDMVTSNGTVFRSGSQVYVDLRDFVEYKVIGPTAFTGGEVEGDEASQRVDAANADLRDLGTTTRPNVEPLLPRTSIAPAKPVAKAPKKAPARPSAARTQRTEVAPARSLPREMMTPPLCGCRGSCQVTSRRGRRIDPVTKIPFSLHDGMDISAPAGTPVVATAYGCVSEVGYARKDRRGRNIKVGYGNQIVLKHPNGSATTHTRYGHMSRFNGTIRQNQCFERGDVIGYVGSTGKSTGNHLHYEVITSYAGRGKGGSRTAEPTAYLAYDDRKSFNMTCDRVESIASQPNFASFDSALKRNQQTPTGLQVVLNQTAQ